MLVYTTGQGAHGFTLDPSLGEFLLSHPNIRTPDVGRYLSVNDSYHSQWEPPVQNLMQYYRGQDGNRQPMSTRYVGSLVADFHRNLLGGGLFAYPANRKNKRGKLRLLYEANPLAFIVEQAGGAATDGTQRILDVQPTELHQRTPLFHREQERRRCGARDARRRAQERQLRFASRIGRRVTPMPAREPVRVKKHESGERLSPSGIPIKTVYRPGDAELDYNSDLGDPGVWPYTRGVQPTMYRGRLWTMRQYAGFGSARSTNERFKLLLDAGQTGLSVAFDLPTQMGLDSDSPRAAR